MAEHAVAPGRDRRVPSRGPEGPGRPRSLPAARGPAPPARRRGDGRRRRIAEIAPFRGLRYDPARVDPDAVLAPPYDVVDEDEVAALHAPLALQRPRAWSRRAGARERFAEAAAALRRWEAEGVLRREAAPALYAYEQRATVGGAVRTRRGCLARLRLSPFADGAVRPHERTMAAPKAERLALLRATADERQPDLRDRRGSLGRRRGAAGRGRRTGAGLRGDRRARRRAPAVGDRPPRGDRAPRRRLRPRPRDDRRRAPPLRDGARPPRRGRRGGRGGAALGAGLPRARGRPGTGRAAGAPAGPGGGPAPGLPRAAGGALRHRAAGGVRRPRGRRGGGGAALGGRAGVRGGAGDVRPARSGGDRPAPAAAPVRARRSTPRCRPAGPRPRARWTC